MSAGPLYLPTLTSQSSTAGAAAATRVFPSGLNATHAPSPATEPSDAPVAASQTRTVLSSPPEATVLPAGLDATQDSRRLGPG